MFWRNTASVWRCPPYWIDILQHMASFKDIFCVLAWVCVRPFEGTALVCIYLSHTVRVPSHQNGSLFWGIAVAHNIYYVYSYIYIILYTFVYIHIYTYMHVCILVGGFNPSEKYYSTGMIIPNIWENIYVPNHQPVYTQGVVWQLLINLLLIISISVKWPL